jgi:iron complex transport system substrate-binding protein
MSAVLRVAAGPALLAAGALWFVQALSTVRAGDLGLRRLGDPVVQGREFPKVVVDPSGRRSVVSRAPRRVVSMMLGADEMLTAMVDPERIVGLSRFANNDVVSTCSDRVPPHAARIRGVDPEPILALEPDLVFAAGYTLDSGVRILDGAGVVVVRFASYRSFDDIAKNLRIMGQVLGREDRAEALVAQMERRLARITERVSTLPAPRVLYYSPVGYTSGGHTLVDEKIERAGGRNVIADAGMEGPKHLAVDLMVALDPDVIIVPRWTPDDDPVRALAQDPAWRGTRAVRGDRVHALDAKWLTSVSQDGVRGVEQLARVLHPEAFSS